MKVNSIIRLECQTTEKHFNAKSVSFPYTVNQMSWLMSHQEILIVHINRDDILQEKRHIIMSGMKIFNLLKERKDRRTGDVYVTFKYE